MPTDIQNITFNVTVNFGNGQVLTREDGLNKAFKLSVKENVIVPPDADVLEVHGQNCSIVVPLTMIFNVPASPNFDTGKVSRFELYKRDNQKCAYCGKQISQKDSTIDHIIPKSKGGKLEWNNVALSCKSCNSKKDNRTPREAGMKLLITPYNPKSKKKHH